MPEMPRLRPARRWFAIRPPRARALVAWCALLPVATPVGAQAARPVAKVTPLEVSLDRLANVPAVVRAFDDIEQDNAWTLQQQVALCEVPAPPFKEAARATLFREQLLELGVQQVRIDSEGNVIGEIRGVRPGPTVLVSGHLDTVFPEGTDVTVRREGTRFSGPGIGDDCRGLAVTLSVARQLIKQKIAFAGRLLVVGTVGEEGAGNLRGVRALFTGSLKDSIDVFFSIDGTGYDITNGGVGSNRYRVTYSGPGGHSYGAFGMPNPIHAVGRAIAGISDLQVSANPKVTFNVGTITGGTSVNSISAAGSFDLDLRSESAEALTDADARVQVILRRALAEERARWPLSQKPLDLTIDTIGIRPAGMTPDTSLVVRTALAAARTMHIYAPLTTSSTDANIPMNLRIPSLTLDGGGVGRNAHSLDESYDDRTDGFKGPQWVLLVLLGMLGMLSAK